MTITLNTANRMIDAGRRLARDRKLKALTICVLDASGHIVTAQREDGSTLITFELAYDKAWSCLAVGHSSRYIKDVLVKERPGLADAMAARGRWVAEYGGVLARDAAGELVGAVAVAGADADSDDEGIALAILEAAGLQADLG
jgi:uncharacterized protein GlcG (DUF336 family)